jgi:hypothetical protein
MGQEPKQVGLRSNPRAITESTRILTGRSLSDNLAKTLNRPLSGSSRSGPRAKMSIDDELANEEEG